ncbi:MAG: DUF554 domain-containing protein [Defluviitaleaceae bacterium]|nr:DUF554 domain-containing protein [Defluviitaleaceae bacterium]
MILLGTITNVVLITIGGVAGVFLKQFLSRRIANTVMQGIGLAIVIIGISGAMSSSFTIVDGNISADHVLLMIVSLALGAFIGELVGIEKQLNNFAKFCEERLTKSGGESPSFAQGFVTATLVFCVGSMAIVGSLEDGINRNSDILIAKSVIDGIAAMIFASTMGFGVIFSALTVGIYQGSITLLAMYIAPYIDDVVVAQMSLVGSILVMAIGLNMLEISKIKVGNLLPAMFIPAVYYAIQIVFR